MEKGEENTNFFQAYAKGRRDSNTIWSLEDQDGREVSTFEGLVHMAKNHFQSLLKVEQRVNTMDIVCLALYFPIFVNAEGNTYLFS